MRDLSDFPRAYRCIVADPPWTPRLGATWKTRFTDKARPQKHYETMSMEEIEALGSVIPAAPKSHLYLWILSQHIGWGLLVADSWGFNVVTMLTWCKPGLGVGRFQCNTEHILVCRKGGRRDNAFQMSGGTWFQWPRGRHSEKPREFYELAKQMSPGPYLELFARTAREGWDGWGSEYPE